MKLDTSSCEWQSSTRSADDTFSRSIIKIVHMSFNWQGFLDQTITYESKNSLTRFLINYCRKKKCQIIQTALWRNLTERIIQYCNSYSDRSSSSDCRYKLLSAAYESSENESTSNTFPIRIFWNWSLSNRYIIRELMIIDKLYSLESIIFDD